MAGVGQSRLATFIGMYWLLGAVLTIRWVLRSPGVPGRRLGTLAAGIGALTAVALLARSPLDNVISTGVLLDLVGAGAIATGAMRILGGFRDDQLAHQQPRRRTNMLVGALDVGLGIALILTSDSTSTSVRFLAAAWGLVGGTLLPGRRAPTTTFRAHERRGELGIVTPYFFPPPKKIGDWI